MRKKCEGFKMGACCDRIARYAMPFGRTFVISLPAVLISHFRSFAAILLTSSALGRLAARVWLLNAMSVMRWRRLASTNRQGYEVYLRLPHMFVPILTDMFNHWFAQGAIPGSVTKGVITLLKKGGRHVWEGLDDYGPITLLNRIKDFGPGLSEPLTACHQRSDRPWANLRCEVKVNLRQHALSSRGPRGDRRRH